jgi:hypothetical protein
VYPPGSRVGEAGNGHSSIARIHVKGRPALGGIQKNFSQAAVGKATDPCRIPDPFVREGE